MKANTETSAIYSEHAQCDLWVMCGPKYNAFCTAPDRREEPGKFFQRAVCKAMSKPARAEEDSDRWDGLA